MSIFRHYFLSKEIDLAPLWRFTRIAKYLAIAGRLIAITADRQCICAHAVQIRIFDPVSFGINQNNKESDSALMLSFAAGDPDAFDLLYGRHKESIYRFFFYGTGGDQALAAELFQDVWMMVVRGRVRFTNDINFSDWLYHTAWARLHDHLRIHPVRENNGDNSSVKAKVVSIDALSARAGNDENQRVTDHPKAEPKNSAQADEGSGSEEGDRNGESEVEDASRITSNDVGIDDVEKNVAVGTEDNPEDDPEAVLVIFTNMAADHQEVALLRYCFGMSVTDISEFLDVTKASVEQVYREAVQLLRNELAEAANHG